MYKWNRNAPMIIALVLSVAFSVLLTINFINAFENRKLNQRYERVIESEEEMEIEIAEMTDRYRDTLIRLQEWEKRIQQKFDSN